MNIAKVIKAYFLFVMAISSMALLSYNDNVGNYISSVLHVDNLSESGKGFYKNLMSGISYDNDGRKSFLSHNENPSLINFSILNNPEKAFAAPGEKNVEMMSFVFKTFENDLIFEDLRLKIIGVDPEYIEKAMLLDEKEILQTAKKDGEYFVFEGIDYAIESFQKKSLLFYIDLSPDIKTGERIRMDIENPDDINIIVGDEPYLIDAYYPLQGKYLSIAKQRAWGLKNTK